MSNYNKTTIKLMSGTIQEIHNILDKKKKTETFYYELSKYTRYVIEERGFDDYCQIFFDYYKINKNEGRFLNYIIKCALDCYFKKEQERIDIFQYIVDNQYSLKDIRMSSYLSDYLKNSYGKTQYEDANGQFYQKELNTFPAIAIFKTINWKEQDIKCYSNFYNDTILNTFLDTIGRENISTPDIQHIFINNIPYLTDKGIKTLKSLGASAYPNGILDEKLFFQQCYFPRPNTTYGNITYRGRENLVKLLKEEDKTINNPLWVKYIERAFDYLHSAEVLSHIKNLVRDCTVTPQYNISSKDFFDVLTTLSIPEFKDCIQFYKNNNIPFSKEQVTQLIKNCIKDNQELLPIIIDSYIIENFDLKKISDSDFAHSIRNESGFTKQQKLSYSIINEMKEGLKMVESTILNNELHNNLSQEPKEIRKKLKI